ncbi:hypothetical protein Nepgr_023101 [Nepenthes gracilis]|uniref:Uncharacterized protein n=1 Tax=Nepenthes gracilis TaxID=150966 RepID=A0AAD3T2A9_NEPGR|nr:hypothetical protein Nepgr_023101 [Nepenthes gracilis]
MGRQQQPSQKPGSSAPAARFLPKGLSRQPRAFSATSMISIHFGVPSIIKLHAPGSIVQHCIPSADKHSSSSIQNSSTELLMQDQAVQPPSASKRWLHMGAEPDQNWMQVSTPARPEGRQMHTQQLVHKLRATKQQATSTACIAASLESSSTKNQQHQINKPHWDRQKQ